MTDAITDNLCPGCFTVQGRTTPCPHCGYDEAARRTAFLLPHRTQLNGQFVVGRVLGKPGGFGITYLGWDLNLETRVAIKEYLPRDLAGRASDGASVAPHSREDGETFRFGLEQFLREARTLAQLDHPNIVRVRQFFEANGTAYLVMDYYQGRSLAEHQEQQGGRLPEDQARQLLLPILDGLRAVHAKGFLHRDIKPQNIYLARIDSGGVRPILLDFGAARQAMGERSRSVSVLYTPGYAPYEQYHSKGHQGPWTDIYSVAAVLYCLVTGVTPPEAIERRDQDDLQPAAAFGASQRLSEALSAGLALAAAARPQTVQQFQARLWDASAGQGTGAERSGPAAQESPPTPPGSRGWPWWPVLFVVLLPLLGLAGWGWERYQDEQLRVRTDERAYAAARQSDSDTAYQVYLSACAANGCAHQAPAEQRLRELALEASRSAEAARVAAAAQAAAARAEEAARNAAAARAAEDARTAAAARKQEQARAADRAAFAAAAKADTVEAYQAYLTGCADTGCEKRAQAKKRLTALAQAARAAEAQRAAEQAQAAPAAQSQRGVYADRAKRTEEEAGTWAYYAEQYARLRGCEVTESGVHLINSADRMEIYKVRCTNSDAYLVQCQNGACRGLNQ